MKLELIHEQFQNSETIEAARAILSGSVSGQYIGLVVGILHKRRRYTVHCAGELCSNPTLARGICLAIDDQLRIMIDGGGETTY